MMTEMEDPWGDDADVASTSGRAPEAGRARHKSPVNYHVERAKIAESLKPPPARLRGAPSLHSMCLGCLASYLEDFLECGEDAAGILDLNEKMALIAAARRKGLLTDSALKLLFDSEITHLEVSYSQVTAQGLMHILQSAARIKHLAMSGIKLSTELLASLSRLCPELQTLRLGGSIVSESAKAYAKVLEKQLPSLTQQENDMEIDDWEEASQETKQPCLKLQELRVLIWLDCPAKELDRIERACPRLAVNPNPQGQRAFFGRSLPVEANMWIPLDEDCVSWVSQTDWPDPMTTWKGDQGFATDEVDRNAVGFRADQLHISERFKQAYEAMYKRQALKKKRNREQGWRRYIRSNPSEQLIRMAENGVPLFGRI